MTNHQLDQREKEMLKAALHQTATDAGRYRKLRAWMRNNNMFCRCQTWVTQKGDEKIYGPTFDAAVDALPEPQEGHAV